MKIVVRHKRFSYLKRKSKLGLRNCSGLRRPLEKLYNTLTGVDAGKGDHIKMEEGELEEGELEEGELEEGEMEEGDMEEGKMGEGEIEEEETEEEEIPGDDEHCPSPSKKRSVESSISEQGQIASKCPCVPSASRGFIEELLTMKPYSMTETLSFTDLPNFTPFMAGEEISHDNIDVVLKMLHLPMVHEDADQVLHLLHTFFRHETFVSCLCNFTSRLKHSREEAKVSLPIIVMLIEKYLDLAPLEAVPKLSTLGDVCFSVLCHLKITNSNEFSDLEMTFNKIQTEFRAVHSNVQTVVDTFLSNMRPPDDFRTINVLPSCQELLTRHRPFLKKNIIKGPYVDSYDYLNIQFLLLREDIIKPLRDGLQHYYRGSKSKNQDVRIYKNVYFRECRIDGKELIYYVTLNLSKRFNALKSRTLMFGNVLCFSHDDFETMIIATVYNRNELKSKSLGIQLIGERRIPINFCELKVPFTMIESKAYFLPYVHTLRAFQKIDCVPFKDYIVDVRDQSTPPKYLDQDALYDFSVISTTSRPSPTSPIFSYPEKKKLFIKVTDFAQWPSCDVLNLDESQRHAFHHALTSKIAIIQGPPGTGKTHIGLLIVKLLLSNEALRNGLSKKGGPMLVVCYTNHALDQFLEGISKFSENIIRVGSRSKNEKLLRFNITRRLPFSSRYRSISQAAENLKFSINRLSMLLKSVRTIGIVALPIFIDFKVIDEGFIQQLKKDNLTLSGYLLTTDSQGSACDEWKTLDVIYKVISTVMSQMTQLTSKKDSQNEPESSEGTTTDLNKDLLDEEQNRRIIFDDLDELSVNIQPDQCVKEEIFELLESGLKSEIISVKEKCSDYQYYSQHYNELTELEKMLGNLYWGVTVVHNKEECAYLEKTQDIYSLNSAQRWKLYNYWKEKLIYYVKERKHFLEEKYIKQINNLESVQLEDRIVIMKQASVVGMTTTAAAQYSSALQKVAPSIVIVEEAAEILEAHVVSSLSEACEHLILIGDHLQLQPKTNVYHLAKKFHLGVSLFERLINNDIKFAKLKTQHRMKPCISNLLVPTIYPDLKDHELVSQFPKIRGMEKDLFFLDHAHLENKLRDEDGSVENIFEANFVNALCSYLLFQGYSTDDITILTPYSGQCRLLKKRQSEKPKCIGVRISILDDYQGEESNIIILSLVRSNDQGTAGFLRSDNRICVAISRAKHGFYMIGNMSLFAKASLLWAKIQTKLVEKGNIGTQLTLVCQNHPDEVIRVASAEDIIVNRPHGSCERMCNIPLSLCNHKCPQTCHYQDSDHLSLKCTMKCQRIICELNHPCPDLCYQKCDPCKKLVSTTFSCSHTHKTRCWEVKSFECPTEVEKELPSCKHIQKLKCSDSIDDVKCTEKCDVRLDCGHQCKMGCHVKMNPEHYLYKCQGRCERVPENCSLNHSCKKRCFESCGPCNELITRSLPCGHKKNNIPCGKPLETIKCYKKCEKELLCTHVCAEKCFEHCVCKVIVTKTIPGCLHIIQMECGVPASSGVCTAKCAKALDCGHPCLNKCHEECSTVCFELVPSKKKCPRNHTLILHCSTVAPALDKINEEEEEYLWHQCTEVCGMELSCGHICKGQCGQCYNGRLHVDCKERCDKALICGHVCKSPCSNVCPPCQAKCELKCRHSSCKKQCGIPCIDCKEKCNRRCDHLICLRKCDEPCMISGCYKPCRKMLYCRHPCIGFCGEPCPKLCRICDKEEVTQIFFGNEDEANARFVILEDCQHVFEVDGIERWICEFNAEIGMKKCPKCSKPIYNTKRFQKYILEALKDVKKVKQKFFTVNTNVNGNLIRTLKLVTDWKSEVNGLLQKLGFNSNFRRNWKKPKICDSDFSLYCFQIEFLQMASNAKRHLANSNQSTPHLQANLNKLVERVFDISHRKSDQMRSEAVCELRRIQVLGSINLLKQYANNESVKATLLLINAVMPPTEKFSSDSEEKVVAYLKEAKKSIGPLIITEMERKMIVSAMGFKQGHWFKCPNGHVYTIGECGGANQMSTCPECKATIGGIQHRLHSGNMLASEMDGATRSAWPGST